MLSALFALLLLLAGFVIFGSLGGALGARLERRGAGENVSVSCMALFGSIGVVIAIVILGILAE